VYTKVVADTEKNTLKPIITDKIPPDSISYHSYNAPDVKGFHHNKLLTNGHNHIQGIENFWNQAKRVLRKYSAISKKILNDRVVGDKKLTQKTACILLLANGQCGNY
jgi:transposase